MEVTSSLGAPLEPIISGDPVKKKSFSFHSKLLKECQVDKLELHQFLCAGRF